VRRRVAELRKWICCQPTTKLGGYCGESILSKLSRAIDAIMARQFPAWWLAVVVFMLIMAGKFFMS